MLFSLTLTGFLLIACAIDLKEFRIPNAVPFALMALFVIKASTMGYAIRPDHLLAFGLTFCLGLSAFAFGLIGGGDAKLMTALALWFGMAALPSFLAITAISGGVFAMVLVALRHLAARRPVTASAVISETGPRLLDRHGPVPYALPIAFAALWLEWH